MGFFKQECWSGLPFPPPGDLPDPRIKPMAPVSPALQPVKSRLFHGLSHWGGPYLTLAYILEQESHQ